MFGSMYGNYNNLYSNQQPLNNSMMGYQDRMAQLQQQYNIPQQYVQQTNNSLQGKIVDSIDVVRATDIPMDGNCYYFPKADGSEVYAKRWLPSGNTEVIVYKPSIEEANVKEVDNRSSLEEVTNRLDSIDERIGKIEKSLTNNRQQQKNVKKEDVE